MRVLYVGKLIPGSTSLHRLQALIDIGHDVTSIDTFPEYASIQDKKILNRIYRRLYGAVDYAKANDSICDFLLVKNEFEILWIDKGMTIDSSTLNLVKLHNPSLIIIGYSPDDMGSKHNQSKRFITSLPCYDFYITTKSYGVNELENLGAKKVLMIDNAYDENAHFPIVNDRKFSNSASESVGFIGTYEKERAGSIKFAADNGIKISIYGSGWNDFKFKNITVNKSLIGNDYAKAIYNFDINLCFLRKINRDLQTTRSIEIPACGGFMLAERSDEHLSLFKEGVEAEFFDSNEEMCEKINFYEKNSRLRKKIANQGRCRCVNSGYSNQKRLKKIINEIININ
jgi:spore maturation protein CgeB